MGVEPEKRDLTRTISESKEGGASPMRTHRYRNYLLTLLLLVLAFNYVDRGALGLMLQDIKVDLKLSDTQLGFLTGIAFAMFYSVMGIPIARWADRGNRVTIISLACLIWSVMVVLCGFAGNFLALLLIRVGVAVGEAGCVPPALSLIAEYFTRAERPRAVSIYMMGIPLSVLFGFFVAGWLNEFYGWRITFMLLGLPGLILATLAHFTLREPRREKPAKTVAEPSFSPIEIPPPLQPGLAITEVCRILLRNRTFYHLLLGYSVMSLFGFGIWQWAPAFFVRSYGLKTGEIGLWFALIWGLGGSLGTYWGGRLASLYASNNERLQLRVIAIMVASFAVVAPFIFLTHNHYVSFGLMGLAAIALRTFDGPLFATIQTLVSPHMRAMSIAILFLIANLIGMGLGPLAAGILSDALRPLFGEESLRYALLVLSPGYLWAGWHLWHGSKTVTRDIAAVQIDQHRSPQDYATGVTWSAESPSSL
jgi:MFS family permease